MNHETLTASEIVELLTERNVEPDDTYTAAAGQDYGYVRAWSLPTGKSIIAYGDNGHTNYTISDNAEDLHVWLLSCDLDADAQIEQLANVRGAEAVEEAPEGSERELAVLVTRSYYGPREESRLASDDRGETIHFASYAEAQDWIDEAEMGQYVCDHNESGSPDYKIVEL